MSIIIAFVIGLIIGGICFGKETDWKCDSCVNNGCVANDSICDHCNGHNHYEFDLQKNKNNCNTCKHNKPDNPYCECCFDLNKYERREDI